MGNLDRVQSNIVFNKIFLKSKKKKNSTSQSIITQTNVQ